VPSCRSKSHFGLQPENKGRDSFCMAMRGQYRFVLGEPKAGRGRQGRAKRRKRG